MKKKLSLIISFLIILFGFGVMIFYSIPRIRYMYDDDLNGYVVVSAYGNAKEYSIPSEYKDKDVVAIGERAFRDHTKLKNIIFSDDSNIVLIKRIAFENCKELEEITIPKKVEEIALNAFLNCKKLKKINFFDDSELIHLGGSVFFGCESLEDIILPQKLKSIGSMCFYNNKNLKEIIIPQNVTNIYKDAFYGCDNLESIYIQSNFKEEEINNFLGNLQNKKEEIIKK